jgi:DinB superfamily
VITSFNSVIDTWVAALKQYSFEALCTKPSPGSWSPGQLYMHLAESTEHYIVEIKTCISNNENAAEEMSPAAGQIFANNDLPDILIEGPPSNKNILQPQSKELLLQKLLAIKDEMNGLAALIQASHFTGKTKHPGLHYFNAAEWLQFATIHLRHHLRQKQRIDDFLKMQSLI